MAKIINKERLPAKLQRKREWAKKNLNASVTVGYTQSYAMYVHENLEAIHLVGQAKFLEQPAKTLQPVLAEIIGSSLISGQTMGDALSLAGLRLQEESQLLCPVNTGALRASAFTRVEQES